MIREKLELLVEELKEKNIIHKDKINLKTYDELTRGVPEMLTLHDIANYRPIHINDACKKFYGFKNNFLRGMDYIYYIKTIHPSYYPTLFKSLTFFNEDQEEFLDLTYKLKNASGQWDILIGTTKTVTRSADGKPLNAISLLVPQEEHQPIQTAPMLLLETLTKREMEIFLLISESKKTNEIAQELFISEETVKKHKQNIYKKLQCNKTSELVKMAFELGFKY
ncbi:LuxR C-terminal-related transcriptional regulator [Echinicola marina]|uniref:response regulator transcription factor n=1 Tax=Echinicola marina TaxID=2859768 RepID=UPI001CF63884|nr:LuxR C-terminal-related transcriptional regulator [Echinicola marina]UCS94048.1 LuxR C-terminal-related transcriptional regulator [Echinicola marina]